MKVYKFFKVLLMMLFVSLTTNAQGNRFDDVGRSVERGRHHYDPAYSNLTLQTGVSRVHGEFIRAKACLGGQTDYVVYGGVGRDWLFDAKKEKFLGPDAKKMGWHAGLGYFGGNLNGETATGEFALMMDYRVMGKPKNI